MSSSYAVPTLISFGNHNHNADHKGKGDHDQILTTSSSAPQILVFDQNNITAAGNGIISGHNRTPLQAHHHLLAERKRRQKLGQLFISLSKVVPGLKKLDKVSLLEDAINYLKYLQERISILEEEQEIVKLMSASSPAETNEDERAQHGQQESAAEIEARVLDGHLLIKIYCKKQMGKLVSKIPCEMEKMNLRVIDMRVMPFGAALDVTVLAEMQQQHQVMIMRLNDIVAQLQSTI